MVVDGRRNGAPEEACGTITDIVPSHIGSPSAAPLPYSVNLSDFDNNRYYASQTYNSE